MIAATEGRPVCAPSDLLKLYVYGYLNRVRSSRLFSLAVIGRPLLTLPHRFFPRLSEDTAYLGGAITLVFIGIALTMYLALSLALSTGSGTFPPAGLLQFNLRTLYTLSFLFGVPLTVIGLIIAGKPLLTRTRGVLPGYISTETIYALSVAALVVGGALAEMWLAARLMAS